jgi:hypothetical protein
MSRIAYTVGSSTICILLFASVAFAQNTSASAAIHLTIGQTFHESTVDATNTQRWFQVPVIGGRSYCAEAVMGHTQEVFDGLNDPSIVIYASDATTVIAQNDDILTSEPGGHFNSRACWSPTVSQEYEFLKVISHGSTTSTTYAIRVVETTLFSNWFFLGGDYSSYTLIRNTTNVSVSYTINWRNGAGTVVSTQTGSLAPNGSTFVDARSQAGALAAVSGTVEIAHKGSMDAIMATTTVLSATTGLSFDTFFVKRTAW